MFGLDARGPKGAIIINGHVVEETHVCVHCGNHFVMRHGSGKTRGFCLKCQGVTCGKPGCDKCIPFEARVEYTEAIDKGNVVVIDSLVSRFPGIKSL